MGRLQRRGGRAWAGNEAGCTTGGQTNREIIDVKSGKISENFDGPRRLLKLVFETEEVFKKEGSL